jgi:glycerol uptake facilitator-like aquaporin
VTGATAGVLAAHVMFEEPWVSWSSHDRGGVSFAFSEAVATFGLIALVCACARRRPDAIPAAVSAYIVAAFWCTSSTSFANPAVTLARSLTDTFAGIRTVDVAPFLAAQMVGAAVALAVVRWLLPPAGR